MRGAVVESTDRYCICIIDPCVTPCVHNFTVGYTVLYFLMANLRIVEIAFLWILYMYSRCLCHTLHMQFCRRGISYMYCILRFSRFTVWVIVDFPVETKTHLKFNNLIRKKVEYPCTWIPENLKVFGPPDDVSAEKWPQNDLGCLFRYLGRPPTCYDLALKACLRGRGGVRMHSCSGYMGNNVASYSGVS
jgi:hypothetical protein